MVAISDSAAILACKDIRFKIFTSFIVACLIPFLVAATLIYLSHNSIARTLLGMRGNNLMAIDNQFFFYLLKFQASLSFLIAAWIGPGLVFNLPSNNALPLYLCWLFRESSM